MYARYRLVPMLAGCASRMPAPVFQSGQQVGQMALDQLLFMRPVPGYGQYATPVKNLYLCGAGTHPGGGLTGAPGYNAARQVLSQG